jgi:site-specific DNA recombinase
MRAAVYARESKGAAASQERQSEDGERLCRSRGWEPVLPNLGDDDRTANGRRARPGFERLLSAITSDEIGAVVAWSWDRLERNRRDTVRLIEACQAHGITIALVRGNDIDCATPAGRLVADMLAAQARHEIDQKADRQSRAGRQAAESGAPPKRRAFGYRPGGLEIDPVEGPAVREAFARLLAGGSLSGITRSFNDAGHRTVGGKPWTIPGVRVMLRNGRYAGIRFYRRQELGPSDKWPAIVSEETWRAAVSLLDDPARRATLKGTARRWLGAAFYLCGRCGSDMCSGYRLYGESKTRVYRCRAHLGHLSRVAAPIDDLVTAVIVARLRREDLADLLISEAPRTATLHDEARGLRARLDTITGDYADGLLTARQLAQATERIEARLVEVSAKIAAAGRVSALSAVALARDPGSAWLALDVAGQQAVARELCTVTLLPAPSGRKPFDPATVRIEWRQS